VRVSVQDLWPFVVVVLVLVAVHLRFRRPPTLCRYERRGDKVVVRVVAPFRGAGTRTAYVTGITSARVVPARERAWLLLCLWGVRWPGVYVGWYWRWGGLVYVARQFRHDALEISLARGRVRQWLVEVEDPAAVVADLAACGVPSATVLDRPGSRL
jgi:hypothetical protein